MLVTWAGIIITHMMTVKKVLRPVLLTILSLMPFIIMLINSTRSTYEIQQHAIS